MPRFRPVCNICSLARIWAENSLYARLFKAVHKVEPEVDTREDADVPDSDEGPSQSLFFDDIGVTEVFGDIVDDVDGADDNI